MDNRLVSVIMPCYNDGKYIKQAIDSIKSQTYTQWELIIIDDGSDDQETINIINNIVDSRIKIIKTDHLRPSGARNKGISEAKGKYILPLDSDDYIDSTYIEKAVSIIESDKKIGVVYCKAELFGEKKGPWELPDYSFEQMLLDNVVFVTSLFYKEDWERVGGFNVNMKEGMEDYDFWIGILELGRDIYQIPETLFYYRIKPISRTTGFQSDFKQMQRAYQQIYKNHKAFYTEHSEQYEKVLRDALIEQVSIRMKYERVFSKVEKLLSIPIIRFIIKRFINI